MNEEKTQLLLAQQQALLIQKIEELSERISKLENMILTEREEKKKRMLTMNASKKAKTKARILRIRHLTKERGILTTNQVMRSLKVSRVSAIKLMKKAVGKDIRLVERPANRGGYYLTINKAK